MWVKNYMFTEVSTISCDATIAEAIKIMVDNKTNSLVVVDAEQKPIGTLSSYTLARETVPAYLKDDPLFSQFGAEGTFDKYADIVKNKKVKEIMHIDFHRLNEDDTMIEAASFSLKSSRRILPVVNKTGKLVGVITRGCIRDALFNAIYNPKPADK